MKRFLLFASLFLTVLAPLFAQDAGSAAWDDEVIDLAASLPVQHEGRIKPLESVAGLELLTFNGKRKLKLDEGGKLRQVDWFLELLFHPERARGYPSFRIDNDAVLTAVDLDAKAKRAWYSFEELQPAWGRIANQAGRISQIEASRRNAVDRQILKLAIDLRDFDTLARSLDPFRRSWRAGDSAILAEIIDESSAAPLTDALRRVGRLEELAGALGDDDDGEREAISRFLEGIGLAVEAAERGPRIIPPPAESEDPEEWWGLSEMISAAFARDAGLERQLALFERLERMTLAPDDAAFLEHLRAFRAGVDELAAERGEGEHISLEVLLNRLDPFTLALVLYLLAFLAAAVSWAGPKLAGLRPATWALVGGGTALVVVGITIRCIIRERPPVVSLYDTVLFVTVCMVVLLAVVDRLARLRVVLGAAALVGAAGMFLAMRYELKEVAASGDTMASVMPALDTNYYLAIHVVTIALGYVGGLAAGVLGHIWIFGRLFGGKRSDPAFFAQITRATYGVVCFSLLLSLFGTIMGGVWANDSWGRFWGWDPKENGALLICIWQLLILHARLAGYIRERGMAVMAVLGAVVVSASWWGVNLLNVGLHSYGFTSGIALVLLAYWVAEGVVVLLAGIDALIHPPAAGVPPATLGADASARHDGTGG